MTQEQEIVTDARNFFKSLYNYKDVAQLLNGMPDNTQENFDKCMKFLHEKLIAAEQAGLIEDVRSLDNSARSFCNRDGILDEPVAELVATRCGVITNTLYIGDTTVYTVFFPRGIDATNSIGDTRYYLINDDCVA